MATCNAAKFGLSRAMLTQGLVVLWCIDIRASLFAWEVDKHFFHCVDYVVDTAVRRNLYDLIHYADRKQDRVAGFSRKPGNNDF